MQTKLKIQIIALLFLLVVIKNIFDDYPWFHSDMFFPAGSQQSCSILNISG